MLVSLHVDGDEEVELRHVLPIANGVGGLGVCS